MRTVEATDIILKTQSLRYIQPAVIQSASDKVQATQEFPDENS